MFVHTSGYFVLRHSLEIFAHSCLPQSSLLTLFGSGLVSDASQRHSQAPRRLGTYGLRSSVLLQLFVTVITLCIREVHPERSRV
jgi:hypothetical protein